MHTITLNFHLFAAFNLEFYHCFLQNAFSFRGLRSLTATRGKAPGRHWGIASIQTPYRFALHALAILALPEIFS
jgi:hypothetical protein